MMAHKLCIFMRLLLCCYALPATDVTAADDVIFTEGYLKVSCSVGLSCPSAVTVTSPSEIELEPPEPDCKSSAQRTILHPGNLTIQTALRCTPSRCESCLRLKFHMYIKVALDTFYNDDEDGWEGGSGSERKGDLVAAPLCTTVVVHVTTSQVSEKFHLTLALSHNVTDRKPTESQHVGHVEMDSSFIPVGSSVSVWIEDMEKAEMHQVPSCNHNLMKQNVERCSVPSVITILHKSEAIISLNGSNLHRFNNATMCRKFENDTCLIAGILNATHPFRIPVREITPCLCYQIWWSVLSDAMRYEFCPFKNHSEFWQNVLQNISMHMEETSGLVWKFDAPCKVEGNVSLCLINLLGHCTDIKGQTFKLEKFGEFTNITEYTRPKSNLCMKVRLNKMDTHLDFHCPFRSSFHSMALPLLSLLVLVLLGTLLLALVKWTFKDLDEGNQVLIVCPFEEDFAVEIIVSSLGKCLNELGFSVSLDLWSRSELCTLGPVPWLHFRLGQLRSEGGKAVVILTKGSVERAGQWVRYLENGANASPNYQAAGLCSPYVDVFSASLSCIYADILQGRAGERFVLAQFESPFLSSLKCDKVPEIFRSIPVYKLPSNSLGFLRVLSSHSHKWLQSFRLRGASHILHHRMKEVLEEFQQKSHEDLENWKEQWRHSAFSQSSTVSDCSSNGTNITQEMLETLPLHPFNKHQYRSMPCGIQGRSCI
ncbi:interleukin-17 receptor C isoform X2 [Erpetoichthys calabaricus]|uniref:SEFIR domain-containing protein n=1 Tax=Erpetoichthys calabaricus TaxID=27687 RepID=A0A8C4TLU7_ERPCA|nr:interleukin-17 receptor C isoform X2 [Erpetoichthys calabaricus]